MLNRKNYEAFQYEKETLMKDILAGKKNNMRERFDILIRQAEEMFFWNNVRMLTKWRDVLCGEEDK